LFHSGLGNAINDFGDDLVHTGQRVVGLIAR
jgi:hypothetical protein